MYFACFYSGNKCNTQPEKWSNNGLKYQGKDFFPTNPCGLTWSLMALDAPCWDQHLHLGGSWPWHGESVFQEPPCNLPPPLGQLSGGGLQWNPIQQCTKQPNALYSAISKPNNHKFTPLRWKYNRGHSITDALGTLAKKWSCSRNIVHW